MQNSSLPLVTIGLPVYNEGKYIVECLDNLLKQTYPNIEIVISDNGSTDRTPEICQEYVAANPNITYIRHPKNLGQHGNFNYLPKVSHGKYFCWASGHDVLEADFVEKSVAVLESDEKIVLAYPRTINMTAEGEITREKVRQFDIGNMSPSKRFREVMWRVDCNYVYGTFRRQAMLETKLFQDFPALDRVFLAEIAVIGTFTQVDTIKYYRANRGSKIETELEKRRRTMSYLHPERTFTDEELEGKKYHIPTRRGFLRAVQDANFPLPQRWQLYFSVWLSSVMKQHMLPGADVLAAITKTILPKPLLRKIMRMMQ